MKADIAISSQVVEKFLRPCLRAVDYLRVSTEEQAKGYGIASSGKRTKAYIQRKGWSHIETYLDEGVSGSLEALDRPGLKRLMEDSRKMPRPFDVVVVSEGRAIGRTDRAFWRWVWELEDLGIYVADAKKDIDNTTEVGKEAMREEANYAFKEYGRIRQRTQGGIQEKAEEGGLTGGRPRYGYRIEDQGKRGLSRIALDRCEGDCACEQPHEYDILHLARELIVSDRLNVRQAAIQLNAMGLYTRSGKPWSNRNLWSRLMGAMSDPVVIFRNPNRAKLGVDGAPLYGESVSIRLDPILTVGQVERLRVALAQHRRGDSPKEERQPHPLSGRIVSLCGSHYTGMRLKEASERVYRCSGKTEKYAQAPVCSCSRIHAESLERRIWGEVCALLGDPQRLNSMAEDWAGLGSGGNVDFEQRIKDLDKKILAQDEAIAAVMVVAAKQENPASAIAKATQTLQAERDELVKMRGMVVAWRSEALAAEQRAEDLRALADLARERLHDMNPEEQREVLDLLDVRVTVTGPVPKVRKADCSLTSWFRENQRRVPVLTDEGWAAAEPVILAARQRRRADRLPDRAVLEAILHKARTGDPWLSRGSQSRFHRWLETGVWEKIMEALADAPGTPVPLAGALPPLRVEGRVDPRLLLGDGTSPHGTVTTGKGTSASDA
ncbi:recombinase family protein [Streptomyces sp. NBC_00237]|uniref:recombinase family protein n=1 Tax=Streptomyces sp. NBC_00237 TaxID=2975687 RepID=UPI0022576A26|nr:recombinase family protein [Streptomyces sp. NBC_00237]MCX5206925.1 recombinase family protein [Streptomyces sp. NBC_00237]